MAYTAPSTKATGTLITSTMYKAHLIDNIKFLHGPPTVRVSRDAAQSLPNNTYDTIQWDVEDWDTNGIWSSTNNDQLFVRTAGKYTAQLSVGFAASTGGTIRGVAIVKNSTALVGTNEAFHQLIRNDQLTGIQIVSVSGTFSMTTSDYLTGQAFQDSGGSLNTSTSQSDEPRLSMLWVSS